MPEREIYAGREQSHVKHIFLKKYLEKVAYHILYPNHGREFVYVDGFSGPWKSSSQSYDDTSFAIAVEKLKSVRDTLASQNRYRKIRCLFIEKKNSAYAELSEYCANVSGIKVEAKHGSFEDLIPDIVDFIGGAFALTFIDPTGYKEYPLQRISPLIRCQGEVLINFMYDHLNRFIDKKDVAETAKNSLFGGTGWREEIRKKMDHGAIREEAILDTYIDRLKVAGNYDYGTSSRILYPSKNRTYFHLVYATRHWKGIEVFRDVEKGAIPEQEKIRAEAQDALTDSHDGTGDLFGSEIFSTRAAPRSFEDEKFFRKRLVHGEILEVVKQRNRILFEHLLGIVLQHPLVSASDLKRTLKKMSLNREIAIQPPLRPRQLPKKGYWITTVEK